MDKRTRETKKKFHHALREMALEMPRSEITVTGLAKRAGVHRKTYYVHYETVDDIFKELASKIGDDISDMIVANSFDIRAFCSYINQDPEYHMRLLTDESYYDVSGAVNKKVREKFTARSSAARGIDDGRLAIWEAFYIEGSLGALRTWLVKGMPISVASMTAMMQEMIRPYADHYGIVS